jgi:hypothetical protein
VDVTVDLREGNLLGDIAAAFATMRRSGEPTLRLISGTAQDTDLEV